MSVSEISEARGFEGGPGNVAGSGVRLKMTEESVGATQAIIQ